MFWQWKAWITPERVKSHWAWYERGKRGDGRLDLADRDIRGVERIRALDGARFVRCDLSHAQLSQGLLNEIELIDCNVDDAALSWSSIRGARCERSTFRRTNLVLATLSGTQIDGGSFARANAENSTWHSVKACGVEFCDTNLAMARLNDAVFEQCDFRNAQLVRGDTGVDGGTAWSAQFIDCDFTGADVSGWGLRVTRFVRCKLAGARGKPVIKEPLVLRDNDLSDTALLAKWK